MPNVLVLGATGYLGFAISQALVRSGYFAVFGTARSPAKSATLSAGEITPVEGDIATGSFVSSAIAAHHIDIVVDATAAYCAAATILNEVIRAAEHRAAATAAAGAEDAKKSDFAAPKLAFIYTSGSWVHGSPGPAFRAGDLSVPGTPLHPGAPAAAVAWRPAHEQAVLRARDVLDVAVLRPGAVYGRASPILGVWWRALLAAGSAAGPVRIGADAGSRVGLVHVDDVADAYVRAAERVHGGLGSWPVLDLTAETVAVREVCEAARRELGVEAELELVGPGDDVVLQAMAMVVNVDSSRARYVLGWSPRRTSFIQDVGTLVRAWKTAVKSGV